MQPLVEPMDSGILSSDQTLRLSLVVPISFDCKAMDKAREVAVLVWHAQGRNDLIAECFQLRSIGLIGFRRENLDRNSDVLDLLLGEGGGMGCGDSVDQVPAFGSKTEDGPTAEAEADGCHAFVLSTQRCRSGDDLRLPDFLVVATQERGNIE
jgi:hypothetical protein